MSVTVNLYILLITIKGTYYIYTDVNKDKKKCVYKKENEILKDQA